MTTTTTAPAQLETLKVQAQELFDKMTACNINKVTNDISEKLMSELETLLHTPAHFKVDCSSLQYGYIKFSVMGNAVEYRIDAKTLEYPNFKNITPTSVQTLLFTAQFSQLVLDNNPIITVLSDKLNAYKAIKAEYDILSDEHSRVKYAIQKIDFDMFKEKAVVGYVHTADIKMYVTSGNIKKRSNLEHIKQFEVTAINGETYTINILTVDGKKKTNQTIRDGSLFNYVKTNNAPF